MSEQTTHHPPPLPAERPRITYAAYIPFVAAVLELPWIGIMIVGTLMLTGKFDLNKTQSRFFDLIAILPAVAGITIGIIAVLRGVPRWLDRIFLIIGLLACALVIGSFGWGFIHP